MIIRHGFQDFPFPFHFYFFIFLTARETPNYDLIIPRTA
jgi:hypothetical protein